MNRAVRDQSHLTRSPQPLRSPSPDIVAANIITSTRTPTTEIPILPNMREHRQNIPLMEEIVQLKRENEELRQQLGRERGSGGRQSLPTGGHREQQIGRLLQELREKQLEIESLKANAENSASKLSKSSKKLTLVGNDASHMRDLSEKVKELTAQNRKLKEQLRDSQVRDTTDEVRQLKKRVKDLQLQNDDLRRQLRGKNLAYIRTEPSDLDTERANMELKQVRDELMRYVDRLFQRTNDKLQELDRRIIEMMSRQTALLAQTRAKKHDQGSTAGSRPEYDPTNSNKTTFNTPSKPITTTTSQYVWNSVAGAPGQTVHNGPALGQMGQSIVPEQNNEPSPKEQRLEGIVSNQKGTINKLQSDLNRALSDLDELRQNNRSLQDENNYFGTELDRLRQSSASRQQEPLELVRRLERQNSDLRSQLHSKVSTLDQQGRDRILRDHEVNELNKIIRDLNQRLDYIQTEKNQQIIRLQHENNLLRDSLESLGKENGNLSADIQKIRAGSRVGNILPQRTDDLELRKEISQLRAEILQLKADNTFLKDRQTLNEEAHCSLQKEQQHLRSINGQLTRQLNQALEEVNREKQLVASHQPEIARLRGLLERMNSDLGQIAPLKANVDQLQAECTRLKRIADESDKSIAILKSEKEYVIRQAQDYIKIVEQLRGTLRTKEEELIHILETRRSPAIEAYLKDLSELKRELEALNLEPLQLEIHQRNGRLKVLLEEKLMNARLSTKQVQDIEALLRQNERLRKEALNAQAHLISANQEIDSLKALIESKEHERTSMQRQIQQLKTIITEYIHREVVYKDGALSAETQKELRQMQEEITTSQLHQQRSLQDINTLKINFQHAISKLDSISSKIREELGRPQQTTISQTTYTATTR